MIGLFGCSERRSRLRSLRRRTTSALGGVCAAVLVSVPSWAADSSPGAAAESSPTVGATETASPSSPLTTEEQAAGATSATAVCVVLQNRSSVANDAFFQALAKAFSSASLRSDCDDAASDDRVSVVYAAENRELTVTFADATHGAITRVLQAPDNAAEAPEMAALVALELSRREAPFVPEAASASGRPGEADHGLAGESRVVEVPVITSPELAADAGTTEPPAPKPRQRQLANAAFFYPLAVNYDRPDIHTSLDFNLVYGVVGELQGLQLGTFNDVRGPVQGLQVGLLINGVEDSLRGASFAGIFTSAGRVNAGLQAAGLLTVSGGTTDGIQLTGGVNLSRGPLRGAQGALLMNFAGGESKGMQVSLGGNIAKHLRGVQVSPLINYAQNVTGMQVGLVNIGKRVTGTQIGLVNIAKDVDGLPIGLVSVSESGGVHVSTWASTTTLASLGLRLATRHTYTLFTLGYDREQGADLFGPGFAMGVRVPVVPKFAVDLDVGGEYLLGTRVCCFEDSLEERRAHVRDRSHFRLRAIPTWQVHPHFSVFAGAGAVVTVPFSVYSDFREVDREVTLGPEVLLGVSI